MEDLAKIKVQINDKKVELLKHENNLKNIDEIAQQTVDREFNEKLERVQNKLKLDEEKLKELTEKSNALQMVLKSKQVTIKQGKGEAETSKEKSKRLKMLKGMIQELKISIEADKKVLKKVEVDKLNRQKSALKELTKATKKAITELKKELKLLEQVYDFKMKGKI